MKQIGEFLFANTKANKYTSRINFLKSEVQCAILSLSYEYGVTFTLRVLNKKIQEARN